MVSMFISVVAISLILYRVYKYCFYRPPGFPPCVPRIPIFGSYLFLLLLNGENIHLAIERLCKFYKSSVIGLYYGEFLVVAANDHASIREVAFNPAFDGRADSLLARLRDPHFDIKGIFFTDGEYWNEQRRFTLRNLRDYGFGRRFEDYEVEVRDEMQAFVSMIKEGPKFDHEKVFLKQGELMLPKGLIGCLGNCFVQVLSGERFSRAEQAPLYKAGYGGFTFQVFSNEYGKLFGLIPWIRYLFPRASDFEQLRNASMAICDLIKNLTDKQMKTYEDGQVRSFIDLYIKEIKSAESSGVRNGFLYDQLVMILTDFLFPSLSTIGTQVTFLFKHLLYRKDVQQKIKDEIDKVVGSGRLPTLDDRASLPYTEASLREIMRLETVIPSSVPHRAIHDTTLAGYHIPKDTVVITGLYSMHNDAKTFVDPKNFIPERFLNADGSLNLKKDLSLPFGAGRRLCAGETFARNSMFLCVSAILQNFNIKPINGELPALDDTACGFARTPRDFWVHFESR